LYACPSSSLSTIIAALTIVDVADKYNIMSSFFLGGVSMGDEVRYVLRLSKASLASFVHSNLLVFFSSLKKGSPFSPSHEIKRLRATSFQSIFAHLLHCMGVPFLLWLEFA
jgi:hypothetical protein